MINRRIGGFAKKARVSRTMKSTVSKPTSFAKRVMRVVNNKAEAKSQMQILCANTQMQHNTLVMLKQNLFTIPKGTGDDAMNQTTGIRVGARVFVKSLVLKIYIESQQYRPNCDYWIYLVRNKQNPGSAITKSHLFESLTTGHTMIDFIDRELSEIKFVKKFSPRATFPGCDNAMDTTGLAPSDGNSHPTGSNTGSQPNPKCLSTIVIPFKKNIVFEDDSDYPTGPNRWQLVVYAWNNSSTVDGGFSWPCGHIWANAKITFTDV